MEYIYDDLNKLRFFHSGPSLPLSTSNSPLPPKPMKRTPVYFWKTKEYTPFLNTL